ncbi:tetratricopeptide repeat protein [Oceanibacterium hippocampi]|nr:tetratricopeptide repeat protein [Oceanibacterium hippocampi]
MGWAKSILARKVCLAAAGLLILSGCAATEQTTTRASAGGADASGARAVLLANATATLSGDYLAGNLARSERDTDAAAQFYLRALDRDPDDLILLQSAFVALLADGRIGDALPLADRVRSIGRLSQLAGVVMATNAIHDGRFDAAVAALAGAPDTGFNGLLSPLIRAWAEAGRGDFDAALDNLGALDKQSAFAPFRDYHAALINQLAGRNDAAAIAYEATMASRAGRSVRVVESYGAFLRLQGQADAAREVYQEYLDSVPDNPAINQALARLDAGQPPTGQITAAAAGAAEALYGSASVLAQDSASDAAAMYLQLALYLRPDFPIGQTLLGDIMEANERWQAAIDAYQGIAASSPYSRNARIRTAWALAKLDRSEEAAAALSQLAADDPKETDALVTLADIYRSDERFADAAAAYGAAIARLPSVEERHWTLFYARGIALERSGEWDAAELDFLKALELKHDHPLVLNYLGYSWIDKGVNIERARAMIERAVEQRPNDGYIVDSLGWALFRLGKYEEAVVHLERAVELRPEDPVINDHLGDALWRVGRHLEARFQWRRALWLGPEKADIPAIEKKLENGLQPDSPRNAATANSAG